MLQSQDLDSKKELTYVSQISLNTYLLLKEVMKICVCIIGVIRPSVEQVVSNIQKTKQYFLQRYPQHSFDVYVCSYIRQTDSFALETFCKENDIQPLLLQPIPDAEIPKEVRFPPPNHNRFRMFYSMSTALQMIPLDSYDCVIRTRLDTEICVFELKEVEENVYYSIEDEPGHTCSDNLGYAKPHVMKSVWNLQNCFLEGKNNEEVLYKSIKNNSFQIESFAFHYKLYQSNQDSVDGVKQWSKRNREWIFDGKYYIRL